MKFTRKWVPASVAMTIAVATLSGCTATNEAVPNSKEAKETKENGNVNATGFPIVKEPITIQMMGAKGPLHADWNDMLIFKEYEKKTNVKVVFEAVPQTGYKEKEMLELQAVITRKLFIVPLLLQPTKSTMAPKGY